MADRLTQLQEAINQLGDYLCNSIGVLQQTETAEQVAQQNGGGGEPKSEQQEDNATLFANLIARTAKDIDILIDSLPSKELTPEKQVDTLRKLELENQQSTERLGRALKDGEVLLDRIRSALKEISDSQLGIGKEDTPPGQNKTLV